MSTKQPIPSVWAYLAEDDTRPPFSEGVIASILPELGSTPLYATSERTAALLERFAIQIAQITGKTIRLVRFDRAEVVKTIHGGH